MSESEGESEVMESEMEGSAGEQSEQNEREEGEECGEGEEGERGASSEDGDGAKDDSEAGESEGESKESDTEEESEEEAPRVCGFSQVEWQGPDDTIRDFIIWTSVDRREPVWHQGRVVKKLSRSRYGYTHEVVLDGNPLSQKRGVVLNQQGYDSGCWVQLEMNDDSSDGECSPSSPCASGEAGTSSGRKRQRGA